MNCYNFITAMVIILVMAQLIKGFHHALKLTLQARMVPRTKGNMRN